MVPAGSATCQTSGRDNTMEWVRCYIIARENIHINACRECAEIATSVLYVVQVARMGHVAPRTSVSKRVPLLPGVGWRSYLC